MTRALADHDISLVCAENSHNYAGGIAHTRADLQRLRDAVGDLPIHLDGSRIFNAAVHLNTDAATLAEPADSVMVCLSKGLGGPIGSLLCGSTDFIDRARQARFLLGGQMRQTGIVAAAGIIALQQGPLRLKEDLDNARVLARGLADIAGLSINPDTVQTNMVKVSVAGLGISAPEFVTTLERVNVRTFPLDDTFVRIVVHKDISRSDIELALDRITHTCSQIR